MAPDEAVSTNVAHVCKHNLRNSAPLRFCASPTPVSGAQLLITPKTTKLPVVIGYRHPTKESQKGFRYLNIRKFTRCYIVTCIVGEFDYVHIMVQVYMQLR